MNWESKIMLVFIPISFFFGILLDRFIKNYQFLTLNTEIDIINLLSLLVTTCIAFMIPFFIGKLIEDNRGIKKCLIDEFKQLLAIVFKIKNVIDDAYNKGKFEIVDRDTIVNLIHEAQLKVNSIRQQNTAAFNKKAEKINAELTNLIFIYDDYLTGGELMLSKFKKIEVRFYRENNTEHSKIDTGIKTLMQKVHKF